MKLERTRPALPARANPVDFGLRRFALAVTAVACAAALAASIAHVLIDLAGNVLLAHDAYDDIGHGSRLLASAIAFLLGLLVASRLLIVACGGNEARNGALPRAVLALVGRGPWAFSSWVAGATLVMTAMMEFADTIAAGNPSADAASLFGGSVALGCALALAAAFGVSYGLRRLLVFVAGSDAAIAKLLESWLRGLRQAASGCGLHHFVFTGTGLAFAGSHAARRAGKRAPPLLRE